MGSGTRGRAASTSLPLNPGRCPSRFVLLTVAVRIALQDRQWWKEVTEAGQLPRVNRLPEYVQNDDSTVCYRTASMDRAVSNTLFTAPHGIFLLRDGRPTHAPEDFTSFLAEMMAVYCEASCITWAQDEHLRSAAL